MLCTYAIFFFLKWKLQLIYPPYFGYLMQRDDSLEKTLMLGKTESWRRGQQRIRHLDNITDSVDMSLSKLQEIVKIRPGVLQSMGLQRVGHYLVTEQQQPYLQLSNLLGFVNWPISRNCCSVTSTCPTLCNPMDCSMPGFPVPHWHISKGVIAIITLLV